MEAAIRRFAEAQLGVALGLDRAVTRRSVLGPAETKQRLLAAAG